MSVRGVGALGALVGSWEDVGGVYAVRCFVPTVPLNKKPGCTRVRWILFLWCVLFVWGVVVAWATLGVVLAGLGYSCVPFSSPGLVPCACFSSSFAGVVCFVLCSPLSGGTYIIGIEKGHNFIQYEVFLCVFSFRDEYQHSAYSLLLGGRFQWRVYNVIAKVVTVSYSSLVLILPLQVSGVNYNVSRRPCTEDKLLKVYQ